MKIQKYLDERGHHSFPISPFVRRRVELQVKVKFTDGTLWDYFIAVHQGPSVSPEKYYKNIRDKPL